MAKKKVEVSNINMEGYYPSSVYCEENGGYQFIDLRTTVNFNLFDCAEEFDFTKKELSSVERLVRYQYADLQEFDIDYCKSVRNKYSFKVISDLYEVLWGIKTDDKTIDSSETIISSKQTISRIYPELRKKQRGRPVPDWDLLIRGNDNEKELEEFAYRVATIGNFMPVPSDEQKVLNRYFSEKFCDLLNSIKEYYLNGQQHRGFSTSIVNWLNGYKDNEKSAWENFVDKNYLKGSFVDDNYKVVEFEGSLKQLSEMIEKRSILMIKAYKSKKDELEKLKNVVFCDFRDAILVQQEVCNEEDIEKWNILYKTLIYELDKRTSHVENSSIVKITLKKYFENINKYNTADIMNGWWQPFKYLFGLKSRKDKEKLEQILAACKDKHEKNIYDSLPDDYKHFSKEVFDNFLIYLKLVYTIGNITPSYVNKNTGYLDSWERKMKEYEWNDGDWEKLKFNDYNVDEDYYIPEKFKENPMKYINSRIELIIKRTLRMLNISEINYWYERIISELHK